MRNYIIWKNLTCLQSSLVFTNLTRNISSLIIFSLKFFIGMEHPNYYRTVYGSAFIFQRKYAAP